MCYTPILESIPHHKFFTLGIFLNASIMLLFISFFLINDSKNCSTMNTSLLDNAPSNHLFGCVIQKEIFLVRVVYSYSGKSSLSISL